MKLMEHNWFTCLVFQYPGRFWFLEYSYTCLRWKMQSRSMDIFIFLESDRVMISVFTDEALYRAARAYKLKSVKRVH